ncbi:MAG: alginate export family protein [Nitrospirota bacterium]
MDDSIGQGERAGQDDFHEGMTLFNSGDYSGARRRFSRIIEKIRGEKILHEAQWMIAKSYDDEGDNYNALEEYRLFLKNYPDSLRSREAKSRIDSMEKEMNGLIVKRYEEVIGIKEEDIIKPPTEKDFHDPDASPALSFPITPRLSMGAKLEIGLLRRINRDLAYENEDDRTRLESTLSLAAQLILHKNILIFGEADLFDERLFQDGKGRTSSVTEVQLDLLYLRWEGLPFPFLDLQFGRQRFNDPREWLYDEKLDAVRLFFRKEPFDLELSMSTNLLDPEEPEEEIRNYVVYATYLFGRKEKISLYGVVQRDPTEEARNPNFVGLMWRGKAIKNQKYWLEFASLSGHEGATRLRGHGIDLGWTSRLDYSLEPSITFGYAFGSGDPNLADSIDRNFQQTGLQDNQGKFNGVTKFKYYGELFEPELSNIMIGTTGIGISPIQKGSLDIVYHYYSQVYRTDFLRDVGIRNEPSGRSRDLGHEVDLIFGMKITRNIQMEFFTAIFIPGKAFPDTDRAYSQELEAQITF